MPRQPNWFRRDDSVDRAARRILRIIEADEAAAQRRGHGRAAVAARNRPGTVDGIAEAQLATPAMPPTGLLAAFGLPAVPAKGQNLGGQVTPLAAAFSRVPVPPQRPAPYEPAAAPALAIPWIIGQLPAWAPGVAAAIGLGSLLSGDTREDDGDFCYERWQTEKGRCGSRPKKWQNGCEERARWRFIKCKSNRGRPDPDEPREWSDEDEETWYILIASR